ncbi:MAG: D-alanyl-D-alanine carboxypeptidase [Blautia sp.]|nr:D-alanyl-D-alanine carboxypeptidase [Blautia sp.]
MVCIAALFMGSCGFSQKEVIENAYPLYSGNGAGSATGTFFAENLCVTEDFNYGMDQTDSHVAEAAGAFNLDTREVLYSQNLFERLYPASTTKILTAYIIIRNCSLEDEVTVSDTAVANMEGSSVCGIRPGDVLTVRELLYGLLLVSGNDAANVLAEHHSGSVEEFAKVMNAEALRLGATGSHFVNANGLPDEDHYTTVYDMYLIFQEAIRQQEFVNIIQTGSVDVTYHDSAGNEVQKTWDNTNRYLSGNKTAPEGITVIGGKTGTTNAAGYCLALYSTNQKGENIISIVFKADGRDNLYLLMDQILSKFAN